MSLMVKGGAIRSKVEWLSKEKKLEAVLARVPAQTAALMRTPPLGSTWVDSHDIEPILCAIEALDGKAGVLRMSRETLRADIVPPLRSMISGILRLFGTSPATAFGHMNDLAKTSVRGMEFHYTAASEHSGVMDVYYDADREIPMCMFVSCRASLEMVFELCGVDGSISDPNRLGPAKARFRMAWS
jgi:hypothetical protein